MNEGGQSDLSIDPYWVQGDINGIEDHLKGVRVSMDANLARALGREGIASDPAAVRIEATRRINEFYGQDPDGTAATLFHLWRGQKEDNSGRRQLGRIGRATVLSPEEIEQGVNAELSDLFERVPEEALRMVKHLDKCNPSIAYIQHMDLSRHAPNSAAVVAELFRNVRREKLSGILVDVACGPGSVYWHVAKSGLISPENTVCTGVDIDLDSLLYAQAMLSKGGLQFTAYQRSADNICEAIGEGIADGVLTALGQQWMKSPEHDGNEGAVAYQRSVIDAMHRCLKPGGIVVTVGEDPVNVTAPTPRSLLHRINIGYDDGDLSYLDLLTLFAENGGFELEGPGAACIRMDMPPNIRPRSKDNEELVRIARPFSAHTMVATSWRKKG